MKRLIKNFGVFAILFLGVNLGKAQLYDFAVGGQVDTGVGESLVGISAKWQPARFFGVEFGGNYGGGFTVVHLYTPLVSRQMVWHYT